MPGPYGAPPPGAYGAPPPGPYGTPPAQNPVAPPYARPTQPPAQPSYLPPTLPTYGATPVTTRPHGYQPPPALGTPPGAYPPAYVPTQYAGYPRPGYAPAGYPYGPPPKKRLGGGAVTAIVLSVCLVVALMVGIPIAVLDGARDAFNEADPGTDYSWDGGDIGVDNDQDDPITDPHDDDNVDPREFDADNEWATDFVGYFGEDGTYRDAMTELAARFDSTIDWDFENIYDYCKLQEQEDEEAYTTAAVCPSNPGVIYVNRDAPFFDEFMVSRDALDTIRHEISHQQIGMICGFQRPPIALDEGVEAVTSSYAILFLGADRKTHELSAPDDYSTSGATDRAAQKINEGTCK